MSNVTFTTPLPDGIDLSFRLVGGVHFARSAIGWGSASAFTDVDDTDVARLPVRAKDLEELIGTLADTPWNGISANPTLVAMMKAATLRQIDGNPVATASSGVMPTITRPFSTTPYSIGDVLFVAIAIPNAVFDGGLSLLIDVKLIDLDDQGQPLDIHFFSETASLGAINAPATSIADADTDSYLGTVSIETGDWRDLGGSRVAQVEALRRTTLAAPTGQTSIYAVGVTRGTPTHTANGLIVRPGISKG